MRSIIYIMSFIFFTFCFNLMGSDTYFCFPNHISLAQVKSRISPFLIPKDRAYFNPDSNCLVASVSEGRKNLITRLLAKDFQMKENRLLNGVSPKDNCTLVIEKKVFSTHAGKSFGFGKKLSGKTFKGSSHGTQKSILIVQSGKPGSIFHDGSSLQIKCDHQGLRFALEIYLQSKDLRISTNVILSSDQRIDLGEIQNDLIGKSRGISFKDGVHLENEKLWERGKVFLTVK